MKKIILAALAAIISMGALAQNATNSPYSQYGYGTLADQSNGANVAMGGAHIGWREGNQVNFGNPASYSGIDSLTFIFDAGLSLQATNFQEGKVRKNANNSSFDYVVGAFRLAKHVGMAFGFMPYSNVGYTYYNSTTIGGASSSNVNQTSVLNTYTGSGGMRQVFLGAGVEPLKTKNTSVSVGVNASYVWGDIDRSVVNSYSDTYVKTLSKYYKSETYSYKLDFAAQIQQRLTKKDVLTLGATFTPGHDLGGKSYCMVISENSTDGVSDTTRYDNNGKLAIPTTYGVGLVWDHDRKLKVALDMEVQKWGSVSIPTYQVLNGVPQYVMTENQFNDRKHFALGADYCANDRSRKYLHRVHVRGGMFYNTPYLKINGADGPKEYGVSAGFGLPIINGYNARSVVNISAQWAHLDAPGMIKENTFRINVGLTFNERWFAKWKVE